MTRLNLRINPFVSFFIIAVALIYDGLKLLIELVTFGLAGWAINPFINIWAQMTFLFWFTYLGVSFLKPGKMMGTKLAAIGTPSIIGLLPWAGSLPFWTSGVIINLAAVYTEDLLETVSPTTLQSVGKGLEKIKTS